MNHARQLYLKSYFRVDTLDSSLERCKMHYRTWKYWHMAMLHAKKIAITVAYSMYKEVCEGRLDERWKVNKPLTFHAFRDKLSMQMLEYDPKDLLYPGDENMRIVTQQPKKRRVRRPSKQPPRMQNSNPDFVDKEHLCVEIKKSEK